MVALLLVPMATYLMLRANKGKSVFYEDLSIHQRPVQIYTVLLKTPDAPPINPYSYGGREIPPFDISVTSIPAEDRIFAIPVSAVIAFFPNASTVQAGYPCLTEIIFRFCPLA